MYNLLCHSDMLLGSIAIVTAVAASIGGLGLLAALSFRRATSRA